MRLTYKETSCGFDFYKLKPDVGEDAKAQKWNYYDALNKLGQLEDTEDELGIDLVTLFKALDDGIYVRYGQSIIFIKPLVDMAGKCFYTEMQDGGSHWRYTYPFSEKGRLWALTKGELE